MSGINTFSDTIVRHINYFTEEYVKQLLDGIGSGKVATLKPFVGSVIYPGELFPAANTNVPTQQFQDTTYIGLMQMVFPDATSTLDDLPAFTLTSFNLDGVDRQFVTIAGGDIEASGLKFSDFIASLYPLANDPIPFNESAIHVLRNISIQGSKFNVTGGEFVNTGFISGSHTLDYYFCVAISGYNAIIQ